MTIVARLEALLGNAEAALGDGLVGLDPSRCEGRIAAIKDCIAVVKKAPDCACGGRKPVYEGGAEVYDVRGGTSRADAGTMTMRGTTLKVGQHLFVLAFLPVEEGT